MEHALAKAAPSPTYIKLQYPFQGIIVVRLHTIVEHLARVL